jgi:hypothetical protein
LGNAGLRTDISPDPAEGEAEERLERTMDEIRDRYGRSSITYGRIIGNDIGIELDEQKDE